MKHIDKNSEPTSFTAWKLNNNNCSWSNFSYPQSQYRDVYLSLRKELITQQEKMCCYCEVALKQEFDAHIEHFKDRNNYSTDIYKYENLLASCQNTNSCGHKKGTGYFNNMVSPLDSDCQKKFTYTGAGKIIPIDENDSFGEKTIELLGLNCKRLKDRRKNLIKTLQSADSAYLNQSLKSCVDWYDGFYTVIDYMIGKQN